MAYTAIIFSTHFCLSELDCCYIRRLRRTYVPKYKSLMSRPPWTNIWSNSRRNEMRYKQSGVALGFRCMYSCFLLKWVCAYTCLVLVIYRFHYGIFRVPSFSLQILSIYKWQYTDLSLIWIIASRLIGAKPFIGPIPAYYLVDVWEQTSSKLDWYNIFHSRIYILDIVMICEISATLPRLQYIDYV